MDNAGQKTILLVEDEAILAIAVKVSLQKLGYTVLTADSGEKSIEVFNSTAGIDLVLMDINLGSGMDGTEAAEIILKTADVPVVFHSSHTEKEIVAKTEKITSYGYVVKNSGSTVLDASLKMAFRLFDANKKIREKGEKLELLNEALLANEQELIGERNFSEKLLESIPGFLYVYDDLGRLIRWNKKHETMTGYTGQELLHMNLADWYDSDELQRVNAAVENIFERGHGEIEAWLKKKNGEKMLMSLNGVPLSVNGKTYFTGVGIDITEKKKAEEALLQQRILLSTIIESDSDAVFAKDLEGRYRAINEAGAGMLGFTAEQVIGHTDMELVPPETAREFMDADRLVIGGGVASEIAEKGIINGKMRFFTAKKTPWRDIDGSIIGVIGVTKDITERKNADDSLRASEYRYRTVVSNMPVVTFITDAKGVFTLSEGMGLAKLGLKPGEVVGLSVFDAYREYPDILDSISNALAGRSERKVFSVEGILFDLYLAPVFDEQGKTEGVIGVANDITDMRAIQDELTVKNKELENYLFIASHDMRSPLVNIQGFSRRLGKQIDELRSALESLCPGVEAGEAMQKAFSGGIPVTLDFISGNVKKMDALLNGLLSISRTGKTVMAVACVDMKELLERVIGTYDAQLAETGAEVSIEGLVPCYGDRNLLDRLFSNLIDNALAYRDPDRKLSIEISCDARADKAVYSVRDNGRGIEGNQLEKIWNIFYRINPEPGQTGNGLGLSIVKRIAERHHGRAWAESERGKGSVFRIELPTRAFPANNG